MPATGREWEGIAELDPLLAERVERYFSKLGDFLLSIADEEDASQLVKGCMGDVRSPSVCEELAKRLWQFAQKQAGAADRVVRGVVKAATCGPYKPLASKEAPEDVYLRAVNASPHLGLAVLEKAIKARKATAGRAEHEEAKRKKWALLLAGYIEEAGLPAVERVRAMGDPNAVWLRAFGARRGNTLKNRCRSWAPVREWMLATHGQAWPRDAGALLQYLEERHQGAPLGKTVPNSIMASVFLMEQVGQVPLESRLSKDSLLDGAIKSWSQQLEGESEPVKQAPLYTVAILLSAELTLMRLSAPAGLRFACFMLLIMIWGRLRCDDLQGISPESITLSQLGLKFILSRTKTSGPGKRVGQLQGFILRSISLSGYDWLAAGVNLLQTDDFKIPRDFLFLRLTDGWEVHSRVLSMSCERRQLSVLYRAIARWRKPSLRLLRMRSSRSSSSHHRLHCSRASKEATTSGRGTIAGMTCQTLGSIATHGSGLPGRARRVIKDAKAAPRARMENTGAVSRKGARALRISSSAEPLMGARSVFLTMLRDVMALVDVCTYVVYEDVARHMPCGSTTRPCPPRLRPPKPLATDLRHFVCFISSRAPRGMGIFDGSLNSFANSIVSVWT